MRRNTLFFPTQRWLQYPSAVIFPILHMQQAGTIAQEQISGNVRTRRHLGDDAMYTLASFNFIKTAIRRCTTTSNLTFPQYPKVTHFDYYAEIIRSIPEDERDTILSELDNNREIRARAEKLLRELSRSDLIGLNLDESRTLFLAALKNLKESKITVAQFASIHILDSAIRTLYTQPMVHLIYHYVNDGRGQRTYNTFPLDILKGMPTSVQQYRFDYVIFSQEGMRKGELPRRMQQPPARRFFNFNDAEWAFFCNQMQEAPQSEQFYRVLIAPAAGCWSSIVHSIQKLLKCMQVLDWYKKTAEGDIIEENIMLVPSFTMFQSALNAKAYALNRESVRLIPTYGLMEPSRYATLKASGNIAMTMYLPESSSRLRYENQMGRFRNTIDGHPMETAFAGVIHDVYHAMREMAMSENVARARMRLAEIARNHPNNKFNNNSRLVDDILVDGELIYSYSLDRDTMFDPNNRPEQAQPFGMMFYIRSLKSNLHPDLKYAFIEDMVKNKDMWAARYQLGRNDLIESDRIIYDGLVEKYFPSSNLFSMFNQSGTEEPAAPTQSSEPPAQEKPRNPGQ